MTQREIQSKNRKVGQLVRRRCRVVQGRRGKRHAPLE